MSAGREQEAAGAGTAGPTVSIVRGAPDDAQLAALVAVIAALGGGDQPQPTRQPRSGWTDRSRYVRTPLPHFPGGWRASALPR